MHIFGIGLHVIIALFFAIHAIRRGEPMYWLFVLFAFPLLGSLVYFVAVVMPRSRLEREAQRVIGKAASVGRPSRELREARAAFDYAGTAQNRMRLADALAESGHPGDAAVQYESCLDGLFEADPELRLRAARAWIAAGEASRAVEHLARLQSSDPGFRPEQVALLHAQTLAASGDAQAARTAFEAANQRFGSFASLAEYAIFAMGEGDHATADRLNKEIQRASSQWSRHTRDINRTLLQRLKAASK